MNPLFEQFNNNLYRSNIVLYNGEGQDVTGYLAGYYGGVNNNPTQTASEPSSLLSTVGSGEYVGEMSVSGGAIQSINFKTGSVGWRISSDGNLEANDGTFRGNLTVGSLWITIDTTDDIQTAIDTLNTAGGGTLYLKSGTYTVETALTGYSSVSIIGISPSETVIDFNSTSANLTYAGTSVYSTGTITSITSGVNVTGSGTSWLANASAGQHMFIGTRWYLIAAVTGDTTLVLAEGYGDDVTMPGAAYRIASVKQNITIANLTIKNSTGTGLVFTDCRRITLDNIILLDNNKGAVFTNVSECNADRMLAVSNTSNGIELTNMGLSDWESINSISNGGHGFVLNNVKTMIFNPCFAGSNTSDGWNITTGVDLRMTVDAAANGGQGIEIVATSSDINIDGIIRSNTSDGIKLTATADNCKITLSDIQGNGGYGVNIAASSCDNTVIVSNAFASNSSGAVNDSGTSTLIRGNSGVNDNSTSSTLVSFGGDGSDGALTITSGTTTIDCGNAAYVRKNYTSISITGTGALAFSNPHAGGTIVILKSQGAVTLTSSAAPMIDMSGMGAEGGAAVTAGTEGNGILDDVTTHKGKAGVSASGAGTVAGTSVTGGTIYSNLFLYTRAITNLASRAIFLACGSGGGGGGNGQAGSGTPVSTNGGVGGRGGGGLIIECAGALNFTTANGISVAGQAGATASNASASANNSSGAGGGGGGGAGGFCVILYTTLTAASGTINSAGGAGGAGGDAIHTGGAGGDSTGAGGSGGSGGGANGGAGGASGAGGVTAVGSAGSAAAGQRAGGGGGGGAGRSAANGDGTYAGGAAGAAGSSENVLIAENLYFN